jgi:hypothetical protein
MNSLPIANKEFGAGLRLWIKYGSITARSRARYQVIDFPRPRVSIKITPSENREIPGSLGLIKTLHSSAAVRRFLIS